MRVAITDGAGGLVLSDRPLPAAVPGGGVVRVLACGLCGSDVEKLGEQVGGPGGGRHATPPGVVLGHEVVGLLERPGEAPLRVALAHHVPCGRCEACVRGHSSLCAQFVSTHLDPGGFAEWLAVSPQHLADAVFPLPESVDDLTGTLLEPLSCVVRAMDVAAAAVAMFPAPDVRGVADVCGVAGGARGAKAAPGTAGGVAAGPAAGPGRGAIPADGVLVAGCGAIGLLFLTVLQAASQGEPPPAQPRGAAWTSSTLFYLEHDTGRAALAEGLGARPAGREPVQVAFVTAAAALPEVVRLMAPGGVVVVFAAAGVSAAQLDLDAVYRRELTLVGVRSGSPGHLLRALDLLAGGRLHLDWLQPDVVALDGLPAAVGRYLRGETLKVVACP